MPGTSRVGGAPVAVAMPGTSRAGGAPVAVAMPGTSRLGGSRPGLPTEAGMGSTQFRTPRCAGASRFLRRGAVDAPVAAATGDASSAVDVPVVTAGGSRAVAAAATSDGSRAPVAVSLPIIFASSCSAFGCLCANPSATRPMRAAEVTGCDSAPCLLANAASCLQKASELVRARMNASLAQISLLHASNVVCDSTAFASPKMLSRLVRTLMYVVVRSALPFRNSLEASICWTTYIPRQFDIIFRVVRVRR